MTNLNHTRNFEGIIQVFMRRGTYYKPLLAFLEEVMIAESKLSKVEREVIAAHVSYLNGCSFCVEAHRETIRALGGPDDLTNSIGQAADKLMAISSELKSLLAFAEKITLNPHGIDEAVDIEPLRKAGLNDETIEDAANVASLFNLVNRLVDTFGVKGSDSHFKMVGKALAQNGYLRE